MSKRIKGLTIEIGAETKGLDKALGNVNKSSKNLQKELRDVDKLLKFNPGNTELIAQKQKLLGDQVSVTKEKLDKLRDAEAQVQAQFEKGEIGEEQYRAFQREVVETESKLDHYDKKLKEVSATKDSFAAKIDVLGDKLKNMGAKMTDVGKQMSMKITAPILAAGGAMIALAKKAGDVADRLLDLSDITGMSTDSIQEWQHVATIAGVSTETITAAVEGLVKKIPQLEAEGGKATDALNKLGISFDDLKRMTPDEQMDTMIKLLSEMDDPLERNAVGAQLFGGAWKDLAPILGMGADEIARAKDEAHELGLVMSEDALQDANNFRIAMDKLKKVFEGAGNQIGSKFAPILQDTLIPLIETKIIPGILKFVDKIGELIEWFDGLSDGTKKMIGIMGGIVVGLGPALVIFGKLATGLGGLVKAFGLIKPAIMLLKPAFMLLSGPAGWIAGAIAVGVLLFKNWDKIKEAASALKEGISKAWEGIKEKTTETWTKIKEATSETWEKAGEVTSEAWGKIKKTIEENGGGIEGVLNTYAGVYRGIFSKTWDKIDEVSGGKLSTLKETIGSKLDVVKSTISKKWDEMFGDSDTIWDKIGKGITDKIEAARKSVKKLIERIKGYFKFKWELPKLKLPKIAITGKFSLNPPQSPKFSINWNKDGAIFSTPTIFNTSKGLQGVGEAGKEAVIPIEKLKGWIFEWLNAGNKDNGSKEIVHELQKISNALQKDKTGDSSLMLSEALNNLNNKGSQQAVFKIGETEFARAVIKTVRQYEKQIGKQILL